MSKFLTIGLLLVLCARNVYSCIDEYEDCSKDKNGCCGGYECTFVSPPMGGSGPVYECYPIKDCLKEGEKCLHNEEKCCPGTTCVNQGTPSGGYHENDIVTCLKDN